MKHKRNFKEDRLILRILVNVAPNEKCMCVSVWVCVCVRERER